MPGLTGLGAGKSAAKVPASGKGLFAALCGRRKVRESAREYKEANKRPRATVQAATAWFSKVSQRPRIEHGCQLGVLLGRVEGPAGRKGGC